MRRDDSGRRGEPELLRYDRKTARERDYRAWVGTQLYERGVLPAEPGDPEAREAWWAAVARHARGRGGWRRKFEAWRRKVEAWRYRNWPFEEDEQPSYGLVGIRGRPPLLVLLGGGDLQAVLNGTIDAVNQFGHHLHALIHAQGVTVKCSRGHYGRHGRCPSCGEVSVVLGHAFDAVADEQLVGWFHGYRAGIRDAAGQLAEAIIARPSWNRSVAIAVIAAQVHLTPWQLRKLANRPAA